MTTSIFERLAERFDDEAGYTGQPVKWGQDKLGRHYWSKQAEVMCSVRDNRYTAVYAAHDLGKTLLAADLIAWWIDTHPPGEAFVISTAPSAAQVSAVMWREVGKAHRLGGLPGSITRAGYPMWHIGSELVGYGRKPADYEQSAFQGIHARYVLVVIDEACGVSKVLYDAISSIVANSNSRVLAIGNPDDPGSHFADVCIKADTIWNVIQLDGLRSPNMSRARVIGPDANNPRFPLTAALMKRLKIPYSTEEIPHLVREVLVDPLYVEEAITQWGGVSFDPSLTQDQLGELIERRVSSSALFEAKVRGVFPSSTATGVIPLGWVEQAMARWDDWEARTKGDPGNVTNPSRHVVGIDVAYGGTDETVLALRYGDVITEIKRYRLADTTETADLAAESLHETGSMAVVDVIGIGAGVYDYLRRMRKSAKILATVIPFNAAASSTKTDKIGQFRFRNDRAAAWWKMRDLLDPSRGSQVCLPRDDRLRTELTTVKYEHLAGGIIKIESKDEIRKRLGRSTDTADAVIQAFWVDGLVSYTDGGNVKYRSRTPGRHEPTDYEGYDPFTDADFSSLSDQGGGRVLTPGHDRESAMFGSPNYGMYSNSNEWDV